ncbi:MAG: TIGR03936 family radical SAM-associated protein [Candidatus Cloacimonas sp.]|jgi:radical SAM-linked protein|nr:TIGR03936 family radical SAM-associated protein [Candidatus Cloacimonas sp.]
MKQVDIEHILPLVEKPSRYIDHEINACRKDFAAHAVRFAFCFPDVYELGISHLGLKILYSIVNAVDFAMADRVYLPWTDLSARMREEQIPLFGWESRIELKAFDVIGITLQTELNFSNVLELLDLAQVDIHSAKRIESDPIVLAGGPCATNPLPLSPFIDVFFMGEAEEGITEIARILYECKTRSERLKRMAALESCYVPALHGFAMPIKGRKYTGFGDSKLQHKPQLLSWQLATHNRYVAEIMRGCSRGCRFCHAGYFYRPVRERAPQDILSDLLSEIQASGWDEAGLVSLSSSDYSCIQELLLNLLSAVDTQKTHISLPSLRVDSLSDPLVQVMKSLGREGLTIAPEAGSQRLREVINKNLSEEEILKGIETAIRLGWQKIKLYFMLGLPTETESDIDGIIELIDKINAMGKRRLQINVTLSPFVPKPFTPFQWCAMLDRSTLIDRARRVKNTFVKARNIKIKYHTIETSILEAALTRGDLQMAEVLESAWKLGAKFDGWNEGFDFSIWEAAFTATGTDIATYLQARETDKPLPWDFVDTGVCQQFLLSEWEKAQQGVQTPDCRELCTLCGACDDTVQTQNASEGIMPLTILQPWAHAMRPSNTPALQPSNTPALQHANTPALQHANTPALQYRYRVYYQKLGLLRFISHLDWMRMLFRRISVLELQTVFTQGFSPHPKVSLSPPLPIGVEGLNEFFDISFIAPYSPEMIIAEFRRTRIPDFNLLGCETLTGKNPLPSREHVSILLPDKWLTEVADKCAVFLAQESFIFTKKTPTREKSYNLRQIVQSIYLEGNNLHIDKLLESPALYDVLSALFGWEKQQLYAFPVCRIGFVA